MRRAPTRHAPDVLFLSRLIGRDVRASDGEVVGTLRDLTARLGTPAGPHLVQRILVRDGALELLIPWTAVEKFRHTDIALAPGELSRFRSTALDDDEIFLVRDVLDTQIIDVVGHRLARVADVVLARSADNRLELVGVEVGFAGVLRRLGLQRVAARAPKDAVSWNDLHLTSERGHAVQLATPRSAVHYLDARGLAALVSRLDTESAAEVLTTREPNVAAEVVRIAHPVVVERVLRAVPGTHAKRIVSAMPAEHASHWRSRLAQAPRRLFLRSGVWPRRRHLPRRTTR
ncbi:MAG: PRC-barrel domain-containing protein [Candidatus Sericytochromatia bacterium]